jgi:hypothetical protein
MFMLDLIQIYHMVSYQMLFKVLSTSIDYIHIYIYIFKYKFIYKPNSKFGLSPTIVPSLPLKEPDMSGFILTSLDHFGSEKLVLSDLSDLCGQTSLSHPVLRLKLTALPLCVPGSSFTHKATNSEINSKPVFITT